MAPTGRGKHKRANRRPRSSKSCHGNDRDAELGSNHQAGGEEVVHSNDSPCDKTELRGNCTDEEIEAFFLMNLKLLYRKALRQLCDMGFKDTVVLQAMLSNGHCYGENDILSNIMHNTRRFLDTGKRDGTRPAFVGVKQMLNFSLAAMVCKLQETDPHMSRRDAMLYLLLDDLNLTSLARDSFNQNAPALAAGFKADSKELQSQATGYSNASLLNGNSSAECIIGTEALVEHNEQLPDAKSQDVLSSKLDIFSDFNFDENIDYVPLDQRDEIIMDLFQQVKGLEKQVKERRAWAQQKAEQAARKLSDHERELNMLRVEREENMRKQIIEDSTMIRIRSRMQQIRDMKNKRIKEINQQSRTIEALRECEFKYEELSAELKASELSASESVRTCSEVAKREKKCLKRLLAQENQKMKLHHEIAAVKQQVLQLETELVRVEAAQEKFQAKWNEAQKAKELALEQLEEERRLMKTTEVTIKKEHEALLLKIETDFQRHKDDLQMLHLELSRLKVSSQASQLNPHSSNLAMANKDKIETERELIATMFDEADKREDCCSDRKCFICKQEEVSVVFLPCAHQVLCLNCSDSYGKKRRPVCPCCDEPIQQRIRVFGAESS